MAGQRSRRANSGRTQNQRGDVIILRQYLSNDLNRFACADGDLRTNAGFFHQRSRRTRQQCLSALVRFLLYGGLHATPLNRSEEHTSELQSLMRISYAVFCLKKKHTTTTTKITTKKQHTYNNKSL